MRLNQLRYAAFCEVVQTKLALGQITIEQAFEMLEEKMIELNLDPEDGSDEPLSEVRTMQLIPFAHLHPKEGQFSKAQFTLKVKCFLEV